MIKIHGRRPRRNLAIILMAFLLLAGFMMSPFLLGYIGAHSPETWNHLSDVGQSYGFASAFLSAIALLVVSVSVSMQARQYGLMQHQILRSMQAEVLNLAMTNADPLMACYGAASVEDSRKLQQWLFLTYRARYWLLMYEAGEISEDDLRIEYAPEIYGNTVAREWWSFARIIWVQSRTSAGMRTVGRIFDEELARFADNDGVQDVPVTELHRIRVHCEQEATPTDGAVASS
ncbi:hypothetical protein GCM10010112_91800 [Actinoplanes lobatus]|uniref:Uncharacterized protein n=1 Tax=Actinoplanes lobatus TaxID=113568 RepID=A0ABQ4AYT2_9ACTN|nr:hypothetical protein GCM10010112_91800 [Actinoplanes lobatus]GIE46073.1 hypothetical protein Alo02nite_89710 [Actinoplanes lobatus]